MKRAFQFTFLRDYGGLMPHHFLLDLGCGTLRGGIPLIAYLDAAHYYGIEAREAVLNEGRKEIAELNLITKKPILLVGSNMSTLLLDQKFDFIWAFSVLIHMRDPVLDQALSFVQKHLKENGIFFANVNIGIKKDGNWQGFPLVYRPFEFYTDRCSLVNLAVSDLGPLKELGHSSHRDRQDNQRMLKITRMLASPNT